MKLKLEKMQLNHKWFYFLVTLVLIVLIVCIYHDYDLYTQPIVKVKTTEFINKTETIGGNQNKEIIYNQNLTAELMNGSQKGQLITLENSYTTFKVYGQKYNVGDELFVSINSDTGLTGKITGVKRDKYIAVMVGLFILSLLIVGKRQGLFSIISIVMNIVVFHFALDIYESNQNNHLLLVCSGAVILCTLFSLLLVSGRNEKTYAAIVATLISTFLTLLIAYVVIQATSGNGLHYEGMEFATQSPSKVFIASILVGSLGAVMDVAIMISSSIYELYEKNNGITNKELIASGREIGKDIMGTMANVLLFAYVSGTIPMMILYLENGSTIGFTFSMNLPLELARAFAGGIGIVLTVPIGLYTSVGLIRKKEATK